MRNIIIICAFIQTFNSFGQEITGDWFGKLSLSGIELRVVFHISTTENGYSSTMDSPDQKAFGIPMTSTNFENNQLTITSDQMKATYTATFSNNTFDGDFVQNTTTTALILSRKELPKSEVKRPQEPKPKFNYIIKEVSFKNEVDNITLSGTITMPKGKGPFTVAVMITGSGPQNRDEEILGHKPFWVIADYMAEHNIAILRFDDRGVGKSGGTFKDATSLDFVKDVEAAVAFLKTEKKIDPTKIGLIGHSEGGLIAPMVAAKPENNIAFTVLMAGPGIKGREIILLQQALIAQANGVGTDEIAKDNLWTKKTLDYMETNHKSASFDNDFKFFVDSLNKVSDLVIPEGMTLNDLTYTMIDAFNTPWMKYFLFLDPTIALSKVKCPVLAINGALDLQVPPVENLDAIIKAVESNGNTNVTIKEFPKLNHLFQECITGSPNEYGSIEQTISPEVLKTMSEWINGIKN